MDRALAGIALLAAVTALVVALAGRGPPPPRTTDTYLLERRIAVLEAELETVRERLDSPPPAPQEARRARAPALPTPPAREPAEWPVVARKLTIDLGLDSRQADVVDKTLEECSEKLGEAEGHEDALWRDRLSKRARKAAHEAIAAALSEKQREKFDDWLSRPDHAHLSCWFLPERKCGGCGKRKGTEKEAEKQK